MADRALQLRQPDFVDQVLDALQRSGVDGNRLTLELTESVLLHDMQAAVGKAMMTGTQMDIRLHLDHLPAVSHVRQVAAQTKPPRCAHLTVAIETGRTHQIRIHLHHVGTPVLGDRQYFSARSGDFPEVPRQMLHASELRFAHPQTGKPVSASAPLPRDFRDWMRTLRLT